MILKNKSKIGIIVAFILLLSVVVSSVSVNAAVKASIKLNKSSVSISLGEKIALKATVTGKSSTVSWTSSNKRVAKVSKKGVVTPLREGRAVITAAANGKKAKCTVTVYDSSIYMCDFCLTSDIDKIITGSPYVNAFTDLKNGDGRSMTCYYLYQAGQYHISKSKVIRTSRGITLGRSIQDVQKAYGKAKAERFNRNTDKVYLVEKQSYGKYYFNGTRTLKSAKYVLTYKYIVSNEYAIRFYFNSAKKLIAVCYTRGYDSWTKYDDWADY